MNYDAVGQPPFGWQVQPRIGQPPVTPALPAKEIITGKEGEASFKARQKLLAILDFSSFETQTSLKVINSIEAVKGLNSLEVVTGAHILGRYHEPEGAFSPILIGLAKPVTFSTWLRSTKGTYPLVLEIGDNIVGKAEEVINVTSEWQRFSVTVTPQESGTTLVGIRTLANETIARTFYIDNAMTNAGAVAAKYIDGDSPNAKWENQRGRSASIELTEPELSDEPVVIDSVILDPITPGVAFNIYYTNDLTGTEEGKEMTEEQWENKLWVHVPQSFVTSVKTTYALPEPITAKFIKIEFSQLQARPYEPGDYQKPTTYKLFPDWVATPFLAELTLPAFTSKRVGVVYDALELGYKPLIDDLIQGPSSPEHPTPTPSITPPASNRVDPETLRRIETTLNTYLKPPAARADPLTLLGIRAATNANNAPSYPVEGEPQFRNNTSLAVSGLDRQAIVLDESMPVMYFWVT